MSEAYSSTVWTCGCLISELVAINPCLRDYFTAVAFLHVVKRLPKHALNDELLDVLATLFMVALWNMAGHYIFMLWFLFSIYLSFFSSPNLSGRRLDVYHTSTHGVALVRI